MPEEKQSVGRLCRKCCLLCRDVGVLYRFGELLSQNIPLNQFDASSFPNAQVEEMPGQDVCFVNWCIRFSNRRCFPLMFSQLFMFVPK